MKMTTKEYALSQGKTVKQIQKDEVKKRVKDNEKFVYLVKGIFEGAGHEVVLGSSYDKKKPEGPDNGDMFVDTHRIEVKSTSLDWTCAGDYYLFGRLWTQYIIQNSYSYDNAYPEIKLVARVNKQMTHVGITFDKKAEKWYHMKIKDTRRAIPSTENTYCCHTENVLFVPITDLPRVFREIVGQKTAPKKTVAKKRAKRKTTKKIVKKKK